MYSRDPATLLVMPMHSSADTSEDWAREGGNYLDYILEVIFQRSSFASTRALKKRVFG